MKIPYSVLERGSLAWVTWLLGVAWTLKISYLPAIYFQAVPWLRWLCMLAVALGAFSTGRLLWRKSAPYMFVVDEAGIHKSYLTMAARHEFLAWEEIGGIDTQSNALLRSDGTVAMRYSTLRQRPARVKDEFEQRVRAHLPTPAVPLSS